MPRRRSPLRRALMAAVLASLLAAAGVALLFLATPSAGPLRRENPRTTALIEQRRAEARARGWPFQPRQAWVPLERIAPRLQEAVLLSEDAAFWGHAGFDWKEIRAAAEQGLERRRLGRGASTLTQQLAKNLWLGTDRSLWRKAREAVLTVKLERALPKRRILTLYLNVAEWGEGVFGAEAAARRWFAAPARDLTAAQAVLLASMLPAPRRASLEPTPRWLARRARRLLDRMLAGGRLGSGEHAAAAVELDRLLAGPGGEETEELPEEEADSPQVPPPGPLPLEGGDEEKDLPDP